MRRYEIYIKGEFVGIVKANTIEDADRIVHQLYHYLTDDDYEIKEQ